MTNQFFIGLVGNIDTGNHGFLPLKIGFPVHFPTNPMTSMNRPGTPSLSFAEGAAACCGNAVGDSEPVSFQKWDIPDTPQTSSKFHCLRMICEQQKMRFIYRIPEKTNILG
jgi:hypothetical protein